jgi:hypothetical protein
VSPTTKFWWRWLLATALLFGAVIGILELNDSTWRFWPLLLLVVFVTAVFGLVHVGLVSDGPDWDVYSVQSATPAGQDARLGMYTRVIAGHLDARVPDPLLRDRFANLAERRLLQRHGVGLRDPRAAALLGDEASAILTGPPRRLSREEIDRCVRTIEEL